MIRKAVPFLVSSLALHAALFGLLLWWQPRAAPAPRAQRVLLEFQRSPLAGSPARRRAGGAALPGLPVPVGGPLSIPTGAGERRQDLTRTATPPETLSLTSNERPRPAAPSASPALPAPAEVLRGLLPAGTKDPAPPAAEASRAVAGGIEPSTALEWEGKERTLLRGPDIRFPDLLLDKGLEADVEASYVILPTGQVARVQITRSSGFASVDRAVEQALGNVLFAEAAGEEAGRIHIRFRLERKN